MADDPRASGSGEGEGGSFNYFFSMLLYSLTLFSSEDA